MLVTEGHTYLKLVSAIFYQIWLTGKKRGEDENTKCKYLKNEKSFLDEKKKTFFIVSEGLLFGVN